MTPSFTSAASCFSSGESKEIIQGADVYIAPGTPVDIIAGADGWKLIPAAAY